MRKNRATAECEKVFNTLSISDVTSSWGVVSSKQFCSRPTAKNYANRIRKKSHSESGSKFIFVTHESPEIR